MVEGKFENAALNFLELASEQRLEILDNLNKKPFRVSVLAKKLDVTSQEIHRNFDRLAQMGYVRKGTDEHYHITTIGKIMHAQLPLVRFLSKNRKFFENHDIGDMPLKFTKRLGVLEDSTHIKGVTMVLDKWKSIYKNAKEFVFDAVTESPPGLIDPLVKRISSGATYKHVITEDLIEPDGRTKTLEKLGYFDLIKQGKIERKVTTTSKIILVINEKEAAVVFSSNDGEPDLRNMFYGKEPLFHEWCVDYFEYIWKKAKKLSRGSPKK